MPFVFVRARIKTAGSLGTWQYFEVNWSSWAETLEDGLRAWCREDLCPNSGAYESDHFRGADYEVIDRPPDEWLRRKIDDAKDRIRRDRDLLERYRKLLAKPGETP